MKASTQGLLIAGGVSILALLVFIIVKPKKAPTFYQNKDILNENGYIPSTPEVTDTRLVGTNKHGKKWLCNDFEVRNGEWWVKSLNCKVKDCFATHYLTTLNNLACK